MYTLEEKANKIYEYLENFENDVFNLQYGEIEDFEFDDDDYISINKLIELLSYLHDDILGQIAAIEDNDSDEYEYYAENIATVVNNIIFVINNELSFETETTDKIQEFIREEI